MSDIEPMKGANLSAVRSILGRIHVMTPNLTAVRMVLERLNGKRAGFLKLPRRLRRGLILTILAVHEENRDIFTVAMCSRTYSDKWRRCLAAVGAHDNARGNG